ncbi:Sulfite exporter TauE/SafE [Meiothermus luteus]|uniref:Probable membrane transporter protein n=1 Tax=Meiothermus luteus TaxID=2026184 RepID=A0A399EW80_9DEIN|nr:sulfite exporter TauE/SafE family protein [Meiothermus luteus]RIH88887.1 Sulfite exporter TauE/SafE [Meiothermus luteus]RMH53885.1 MAG: sulfite exporter TauE/SafE family protein [Deinococcota bacterium]
MEILIGFLIAVAIGLSGVGGGTLTAPVLLLFLDVPVEVAVGTALLYAFFAKIPAGLVYLRQGQVDRRTLGLLLLGGIPAAAVGSLALGALKSQRELVLVVIGATVLLCALANLYLTFRKDFRPKVLRPVWLVLGAAFIGLEMGFSSAGAGALGTLLLLSGTRLGPKAVVGTDIWFGLGLGLVGGGLHAALGQVDPTLLLKLGLGGLLGSLTGALLAQHVAQRPFRVGLLFWLIFVGSHLVLKGVR